MGGLFADLPSQLDMIASESNSPRVSRGLPLLSGKTIIPLARFFSIREQFIHEQAGFFQFLISLNKLEIPSWSTTMTSVISEALYLIFRAKDTIRSTSNRIDLMRHCAGTDGLCLQGSLTSLTSVAIKDTLHWRCAPERPAIKARRLANSAGRPARPARRSPVSRGPNPWRRGIESQRPLGPKPAMVPTAPQVE